MKTLKLLGLFAAILLISCATEDMDKSVESKKIVLQDSEMKIDRDFFSQAQNLEMNIEENFFAQTEASEMKIDEDFFTQVENNTFYSQHGKITVEKDFFLNKN